MVTKDKIEIREGNVYLFQARSYSEYGHCIYEWKCLKVSDTSYKFEDVLTDRIFWEDKDKFFNCAVFGPDGYYIKECLYDVTKDLGNLIQNLGGKLRK